jgi:hypothetical protein
VARAAGISDSFPYLIIVEYLLLDEFAREPLWERHDGLHLIDLDQLARLVHLLLRGGGQLGHQLSRGELIQDAGLEFWQSFKPPAPVHKHLRRRGHTKVANYEFILNN